MSLDKKLVKTDERKTNMARKKAVKKPEAAEKIIIPAITISTLSVKITGDSPLICHKWSEKAKQEMRDKQMKKAKAPKEAKDPDQCFRDSLYEHPDGGYGFPAIAFKASAVQACSHIDGVTKVLARGAFHIDCELVKINGTPTMREDMVKIGNGIADLRYRGEFKQWSTEFQIRFNPNILSKEQILNLFNMAGFSCGIGEWRPQRDGSFGMFHVDMAG